MNISPHAFWLYTLAVCAVAWGTLGLRFSVSVLAANGLLAVLLFSLRDLLGDNFLYALIFCYPLYWGAAFALFSRLDGIQLPFPGPVSRFIIGLLAALSLLCIANRDDLEFSGHIFHAAFVANTAERPALLRRAFAQGSLAQVCKDSHANLMALAVNAKDGESVHALIDSFAVCPTASRTMQIMVKPLIDQGRAEELSYLLDNGLKPSSLVFGADYANGAALAYAATAGGKPEIVKLIAARDPEDAKKMKYFSMMIEALQAQENSPMLRALNAAGLMSR